MHTGQLFDTPLLLIAIVLLALIGLGYAIYGIIHSATENRARAALIAAAGFAVGFIVVASFSVQMILLLAVLTCLYRAVQLGRQLTRDREDKRTRWHFSITVLLTIALSATLLFTTF